MKFYTDNLILLILSIFVSSHTFLSNPQQALATCMMCKGNESREERMQIEREYYQKALTHDILGRPYSSSQSGDSGNNFFIILMLILSPIGIYLYLRSGINKDEQ